MHLHFLHGSLLNLISPIFFLNPIRGVFVLKKKRIDPVYKENRARKPYNCTVNYGKPAKTHRTEKSKGPSYTTKKDGGAQPQDIAAKLNTKATQQLRHRRRGVIIAELTAQAIQQRRLHNRSDTEAKVAKAKSSSDI
jgi:hypothetical protein